MAFGINAVTHLGQPAVTCSPHRISASVDYALVPDFAHHERCCLHHSCSRQSSSAFTIRPTRPCEVVLAGCHWWDHTVVGHLIVPALWNSRRSKKAAVMTRSMLRCMLCSCCTWCPAVLAASSSPLQCKEICRRCLASQTLRASRRSWTSAKQRNDTPLRCTKRVMYTAVYLQILKNGCIWLYNTFACKLMYAEADRGLQFSMSRTVDLP